MHAIIEQSVIAYFAKRHKLICMWRSYDNERLIQMNISISYYYIIVQQKLGEI